MLFHVAFTEEFFIDFRTRFKKEAILLLKELFTHLLFHIKPIPCIDHKNFVYIFANCYRQLNFAVIFPVYHGKVFQNILPMPSSAISPNCKHLDKHQIRISDYLFSC